MSMPFYKMQRPPIVSSLLKWESEPEFCREVQTLKAGDGAPRKVKLGTPLAMVFAAGALATSAAAAGANTGNGTLTFADPATTTAARIGAYSVTCTTGGPNGTAQFTVEGPDGAEVGTATAGTAFARQIRFTIEGGDTDFVAGDGFTVSVTATLDGESGTLVAWDPDGEDGSQHLYGVSLVEAEAKDGEDLDQGVLLTRRDSILYAGQMQWPATADAAVIGRARAAFEAMPNRILIRD